MADGDEPDQAQKTEEPTQKKLEESRKKGQVPLSREVNHWIIILAGTLLVALASPYVLGQLKQIMTNYIENAHALPSMPGGAGVIIGEGIWESFLVLALPLFFLVIAAIAGPLAQVGPLFAPELIKPKLEKISPLKGFKRLFSMRSLVEFGKGVLKITIVAIVGTIVIYPFFGQIEHMIGLPMPVLLDQLLELVIRLMSAILIVLIIVAVIDLTYQRKDHYEKMKMTKQEVKDEFRQSEGDPHVKARLRQLRVEKSRQRMMQAVPNADVVITNPTHYALALKYDQEVFDAPICVAKGLNETALRIRELAKESGVEVVENKPLARALYEVVEIDEPIPPEHYKAVAEIISFVFKKKGRI